MSPEDNQIVADYAIDFRTTALLSDWNSAAQYNDFLLGREDYIKDQFLADWIN